MQTRMVSFCLPFTTGLGLNLEVVMRRVERRGLGSALPKFMHGINNKLVWNKLHKLFGLRDTSHLNHK